MIDWLTEENAVRLAAQIKGYWKAKGSKVNVWIEKTNLKDNSSKNPAVKTVYSVKTDLVNGLPQRASA